MLILGASSEVGIKLIKTIHSNYTRIYAHYSSNDKELLALKEMIGEKLVLIQADFSTEDSCIRITNFIDSCGVWPNHMIHLPSPRVENTRFKKTDWETFSYYLNTCLKSAVCITREMISHLEKEKQGGRIVFMLTSYVNGIPPKYLAPYVTTKYALLGLMKALATEYDNKGITVNAVSPGMMETKFLENIFEHAVEENAKNSVFGRNLLVDEVIPTFEYLLSDGASRITGQNIIITGGNIF